MLKLLDKLIFIISTIAMLSLLATYTSSYINPNVFVLPSLLALAYPYLLISNIILLFYWIMRWKKMIWIELIVILLGIPVFTSYFGTTQAEEEKGNSDIFLLSYNVRYFDFYQWSNQKNTKNKLWNYLQEFSGNIICLQEFSLKENKQQTQLVRQNLKNYSHCHIRESLAIFSKFPILQKGYLSFEKQSSGSCIYCDLILPKDTIRIYNIHLESYRLGQKERQFMKEISQGKTNELSQSAKTLTNRVIQANKNRAWQAEKIKNHIQESPHPVIVCGDFNDTPLSYTYKEIKADLKDSFLEKGRGLGHTYVGEFPSFRIDYILHTPRLETISYYRDLVEFSDHYPIQSKLKYKTS